MVGEADAKPKTKIYHIDDNGNIAFRSERKSGEVRIPNYVYDLWLPLLGIEAIGVYTLYCRLEREETVKAITQDRIARLCKMGKVKLRQINDWLQDCGFITVKAPKGRARANHHTTEIIVKDPPSKVDATLIGTYQSDNGYEPLTTWLCEVENHEMYSILPYEVLDRTSRSSEQNVVDVPDRTPIIVASLSVASLEVEEEKEIPAPIVADTPPTPEPTIIEENTPALPDGSGKILAFPSATETIEDTPPRAELHQVVEKTLDMKSAAYGLIEKYVNFFTGQTPEYSKGKGKPRHNGEWFEYQINPAMSIDEIGAFGRWYRAGHSGGDFPSTCITLNKQIAKFRAAKDHDRYVERFNRDRTDTYIVDDSALPKAAGAEGDAIPISADKKVEAERLMSELLAKMNGNGVKRGSTNGR